MKEGHQMVPGSVERTDREAGTVAARWGDGGGGRGRAVGFGRGTVGRPGRLPVAGQASGPGDRPWASRKGAGRRLSCLPSTEEA